MVSAARGPAAAWWSRTTAAASTPSAPTARLGLAGIRERVELLGGQLRIESSPDGGTAVVVDLETGVSEPIRILLVDDHAVLRAGLRLLLEREEGLEPVGEAATAEDAAPRRCRGCSPTSS